LSLAGPELWVLGAPDVHWLDVWFGRVFWTSVLDVCFGRLLWTSVLDVGFGRRFWTCPLIDAPFALLRGLGYEGCPCQTQACGSPDFKFCSTSFIERTSVLDVCFGRLLWTSALDVCFGRLFWTSVLDVCFGRLLWTSQSLVWTSFWTSAWFGRAS
jgi:hypothetical protein